MSRSVVQRFPRRVLIVTLLGVLALSIFAAARLARHKGLQLVHASAEARGWGLEAAGVRTRLDGRVRFASLCISLLDDEHQDLCLNDLRVHISPISVLRGGLVIDAVTAATLRVDTEAERLAQFRSRDAEGDSAPTRNRRIQSLERVRLDDVSITLRDAQQHLSAELKAFALEADDDGWQLHANGQLRTVESSDALLSGALTGLVGQHFHLQSYWEREASLLRDASLTFDTPVVAVLELREQVELSLTGLTFAHPYSVRILDPKAELPAHDLKLEAAAIETHVGHWTTHIPDFYLASMTVESPVLHVPTSKAEETLRMVRALTADALASRRAALAKAATEADGETASKEDSAGAPSDGATAAPPPAVENDDEDEDEQAAAPPPKTSSFASRLQDELAHRHWWEIVPRAIRVDDAVVHFHDEDHDAPSLRLEELRVEYGLRVLHRQLDLVLSGQLRNDERDAGEIELEGSWDYERKIARVEWTFDALDLMELRALLPSKRLQLHSGQLHLEGRIRTERNAGFTGSHLTRLDHLKLEHPRLQKPLEVTHVQASGPLALKYTDGSPTLSLTEQALELEEAKAVLSLVFDDFRLFEAPRASHVDVLFEVPDQPAMQLFSSIPASLRGPVADAQMSGPWGLTLGFRVERTGALEDGRPLWDIQSPTIYRLRDQKLSLRSLPEAVDVRRLNGAMTFTFRGPNDEMMRPMRIPAPRGSSNDGSTAQPGHDGQWVPLRAMSYYFVATQLYREDGSFFRNSGINWLQIRRVLSEALTTRELSRGASTITMQTVKNVFLSHERSIERKLQELFLAYWMTRAVPKERILEVYLNIIELGPNRNGADEASRFHFHTPIQDLGLRESVWLSSISPNPVRIGGTQPKGAVPLGSCVRCDRLIEGLYKREWISAAEHRAGLGNGGAPDELLGEAPATLPFFIPQELGLETPPLFDLLSEGEAPESMDRLPVEERLSRWIKESRTLRGTGESSR